MDDCEYVFRQYVKDKKNIGRNAKYMNRTGKGGVKFPSDYLTNKEKKKLNGSVNSYDMGKPMTYKEFKAFPDDIKKMYLEGITEKFHPTQKTLAEFFGVSPNHMHLVLKDLGVKFGHRGKCNSEFNEEAWKAWAYGDELKETIVPLTYKSGVVITDVTPEKRSVIVLEICKWKGDSRDIDFKVFDSTESAEQYVNSFIYDITKIDYNPDKGSDYLKAWKITPAAERYVIHMHECQIEH